MTIENLEIRCEELQKKIDELTENLRQRAASPFKNNGQQQSGKKCSDWETLDTQGGSEKQVGRDSSVTRIDHFACKVIYLTVQNY